MLENFRFEFILAKHSLIVVTQIIFVADNGLSRGKG